MTCRRALHALLLAGALALAQPAAAVSLPRPVLATEGALQMAGAGEMRGFGRPGGWTRGLAEAVSVLPVCDSSMIGRRALLSAS